MASVARAIEQAASCSMDETLWWDSYESLFHLLDDFLSGSRKLPSNQVAENLRANHTWLLDSLLRFKQPNAKSRSALDVARVVMGKHKLDIKSELKSVALDISKQLMLDEVQSYILVSRCFDDEAPFSTSESFQKVSLRYFTERQCLLKCVRLLLLSQTAEPSVNSSSRAFDMEVNSLIKEGLEDKLLAVLEMLLTVEQPLDMDILYINLWAEQVVMEEHLVLDAMFFVYFKPICSCSFTRWKELFIMFKEKVFGGTNVERLSLTAEATVMIEHVKHQCVLIMLEGLDLDKLLLMVHEDVSFSQDRHPFAGSELQQINGLLSELDALEMQDYAPLLLGWGIFGCLVSFLPMSDKGALDLNHTFYTQQAYEAGAFKYIQNMLCHKVMQETLVDGYKCVVKSTISTFVAAYDIMSQNDTAAIDNVVDILKLVYSGQEMLCTEFWDRENILDGPLRNLLYSLLQSFPYRWKTLVQLLAGLAEGAWPAECVYDFLYKPSEITSVFQETGGVFNSHQQVIATMAVPIPEVPGLFIPPGTAGQCLRILDEQKCLVLWQGKYSAIVLLLLHLVELIGTVDSWGETHAIVNLLHRMICSNKVLNLLLSLSQVRSGVETLQSAGAFSHILRFTDKLKEELSRGEVHGPFSAWKGRTRRHELWGLSAAIVAAFVQALGENNRERAVESAFTFLDAQKEHMLHVLQSPGYSNTESRKLTRSGHSETTVSALQETHQVLHVLVVLVRYHAQWSQVMGALEVDLRHKCIHLLAYIAKEGIMRNGSSVGKASFRCYPITKDEIHSHRLPSPLNTTAGWFGLSAKGVCTLFVPNNQAALSQLSKMSSAQSQTESVVPTVFSDSVAVYVYRVSLLLLELLCRQAHHVAVVLNEGGTHSFDIFPEFPAPEVLHGLQDQVMSILRDICSRGSTGMILMEVQQACRLLLLILEKALYLEAFVTRICGLGPLALRAEEFLKDYKALLNVCEGHKFLDASLKALKPVIMLAFPSLS